MRFSVIYEQDDSEAKIADAHNKLTSILDMRRTESDSECRYDYIDSDVMPGHHGKWVGVLSKNELQYLSNVFQVYPEHMETGPVIGAPGLSLYDCAEALYFKSLSDLRDAAVVPIPEMTSGKSWPLSEREVKRLHQAIYNHFNYSYEPSYTNVLN